MGSIYRERNEINLKCYIGKSHNDAVGRSKAHRNGRGNRLLKQAIAKYGIENFTFEILHDGVFDELLNDFEIAEIAKHDSVAPNGYNLTEGGDGVCGHRHSAETKEKMARAKLGKKASDETKRKMSKARKGENSPNYGKPMPESQKRKISKTKTGKKQSKEQKQKTSEVLTGRTFSDEHKRNLSKAAKGRKHSHETLCKMLGMSPEALTILIGWLLRDGWTQTKIAKELRKPRKTIAKYKP